MNLQTKVDLVKLLKEVKELEFWEDGSKALMAIRPCTKVTELFDGTDSEEFKHLKQAIIEISDFCKAAPLYMMINIIPPGVEVPIHTDTLVKHPILGEYPKLERYHLPRELGTVQFLIGKIIV